MKIFLQIMALLLSAIGVILCARKKRAFWLFSIASGIFWFAIYYVSALYIALVAQTLYTGMNVWGWWSWRNK